MCFSINDNISLTIPPAFSRLVHPPEIVISSSFIERSSTFQQNSDILRLAVVHGRILGKGFPDVDLFNIILLVTEKMETVPGLNKGEGLAQDRTSRKWLA